MSRLVSLAISFLLGTCVLGIAACATDTQGRPVDFAVVRTFEIGKSHDTDVESKMGDPYSKGKEADGQESWLYTHINAHAGWWAKVDQESKSAAFLFRDHLLTGYYCEERSVHSKAHLFGAGAESGTSVSSESLNKAKAEKLSPDQLRAQFGVPTARRTSFDGTETWTYTHTLENAPTTSAVFQYKDGKMTDAVWSQAGAK